MTVRRLESMGERHALAEPATAGESRPEPLRAHRDAACRAQTTDAPSEPQRAQLVRADEYEAIVQRVRALERENAAVRGNAERLEQELRAERSQLDKLRRSRSWRYTRPLHHGRVALRDGWKSVWRLWKDARAPARAASGPAASDRAAELEGLRACLHFPAQDAPLVSVIIPCHGGYAVALACLRSIQDHLPTAPIEIIVVDDASKDADMDRLAAVPGLRYLSRTRELGLQRSCNEASLHARGRYIHFLRQDTEVMAGWLDTMLELFASGGDCGLAGSRLLCPDGRQQAAGGIVWKDAGLRPYGRLDDPQRSVYGYVRRADCCASASMLIGSEVWRELGGFDTSYATDCWADADLAFRVRELGLQVYYQPESQVIHHEGVVTANASGVATRTRLATDQKAFRERWRAVLQGAHGTRDADASAARDRSGRPLLLIVDHGVPQPDRDAGSKTIFQFIQTYLDMGWSVKFWPDNLYHDPLYTRALQQLGVEVIYGPEHVGRFGAWMQESGRHIDRVLLSRPEVAASCFGAIRQHSSATVMYYGHDMHHLRIAEQLRIHPHDTRLVGEEAKLRALEEQVWRLADIVYYPSREEVAHAAAQVARRKVSTPVRYAQPYYYEHDAEPAAAGPHGRRGLLFVAGFAHAPNVDAAVWFCAEVLPALHAEVPELELWLVGSNPTAAVQALAGAQVHVTGYVPDSQLRRHYASARVAVAPMRFGAGLKNKVVEAFAHGCPVVTTSVGYQGLRELAAASPAADTAAAFVAQTLLLLRDDGAWVRARRLGTDFVRRNFTRDSMRASLTLETETAAA